MSAETDITITDVDKDRNAVYVFFGKTGQIEIEPVEDQLTVQVSIYIDDLDPVDRIQIVDDSDKWDLRALDNYFYDRKGTDIHALAEAEEPLASEIGRWFITYTESGSDS